MPIPKSILYLTEADVQKTLTVGEAVDLAEKGIMADGAGEVVGDKFYMSVGDSGFIKPFSGYIAGEELAFVKTFSYFDANPQRFGCSTTSSMVLLFDTETGLPVCIMEGGWITALKTGASSAVTAAYLANKESDTITIFGAGMLGRTHLQALIHRFSLRQVFIIDKYPEAAAAYVNEMESMFDFQIEQVLLEERERAVRASDVIMTVTTGDMPLVKKQWLKPGAFVARLGSYQEVELDVITTADKVIVDNWYYVRPRIPELVTLESEGRFGESDLHASWPDIIAGRVPGRESSEEVIVYIALGIWGEYAAILPEVYRKAKAKGLGQELSLSVNRVN
jgi:ornithine cyclodeaminase/alanine dehydrogenase-like protein (mu-crystallin family)